MLRGYRTTVLTDTVFCWVESRYGSGVEAYAASKTGLIGLASSLQFEAYANPPHLCFVELHRLVLFLELSTAKRDSLL